MNAPTHEKTDAATSHGDSAQIGIYIHRKGSMVEWWTPTEQKTLLRLIINALQYVEAASETVNPSKFAAIEGQLVIVINVTDVFAALQTMQDELSALELLPKAQIAWRGPESNDWKNHYPVQGAASFEQILEEATTTWVPRMAKFVQQSRLILELLEGMRESLKLNPPNPGADDPGNNIQPS
jgi:hypothetical protein